MKLSDELIAAAAKIGSITIYNAGMREPYFDIDGNDLWCNADDFPKHTLDKISFLADAANFVLQLAREERNCPNLKSDIVKNEGGLNNSLNTIIRAVRYLADNERPKGGQDEFNSEHLLQIANEANASIGFLKEEIDRQKTKAEFNEQVAATLGRQYASCDADRIYFRDELKKFSEQQAELTRELDIAMHGKDDAAPQASLCDLIALELKRKDRKCR